MAQVRSIDSNGHTIFGVTLGRTAVHVFRTRDEQDECYKRLGANFDDCKLWKVRTLNKQSFEEINKWLETSEDFEVGAVCNHC